MLRKRVITATLVLLGMAVFLGSNPALMSAKEKFQEKFEKTVGLAKDGRVILRNIAGDIEVKVWDKSEVQIRALKISNTDSEELAKQNFEKVTIEISEEGKTLRIETNRDREYFHRGSDKKNVTVDFWLMIPNRAEADMKSVSGDIHMEDIGADAKADTVSGDIVMLNTAGVLKAHAVSGDLTITGAARGVDCESVSGDLEIRLVKGGAELKTVSGDILLEDSQGDVEADVVSGDIDLIDISGADEVRAKSVNGGVNYQGSLSRDGSYTIHSLSGDVTLLIPGDSAFDLYAKSFSGDLKTDFEITLSGTLNKRELRGKVNGGGAELSLKTFSGDVHLKKR
jgi:DUF4097 and DUF4098 domain-containing protein YvlB